MKITNINWDNLRLFLAVARAESAQEAARRIDIDHSTLTRRIHRLEQEIGTQLFSRTSTGHQLTPAGQQFLQYIDRVENTLVRAEAEIGGGSGTLTGPVRLGATDGFGSYFIAPHLTRFCDQHPKISVELIAAPRFVNLSKREADLAINIERPHGNSDVVCKLSDYRLRLYATREYLAKSPPIHSAHDLEVHRLIGYVDELAFSPELGWLRKLAPNAFTPLRSTSIVAQYIAARQGRGLAVLPCYLAAEDPKLFPVLKDDIDIVRTFWLAAPAERRKLAKVQALWNFLKAVVVANQPLLMGEATATKWID